MYNLFWQEGLRAGRHPRLQHSPDRLPEPPTTFIPIPLISAAQLPAVSRRRWPDSAGPRTVRALPRQQRARNQLLKIVRSLKVVRDILLFLLLRFLSPVSEWLIIHANFLHGANLKTIPDYHSCRFVREATVWALPSLDIVSRDHQLAGRAFDEPARLSLAGLGDGRRWARLARACG